MQLKTILIATLMLLAGFSVVLAQNKNVNRAEDDLKDGKIDAARGLINEAATNDKTSDKAKTWYLKGEIYTALAKKDSASRLGQLYNDTAFAAYKECLKLDPKYPSMLLTSYKPLSNLYVDYWKAGANAFNSKDYADAFKAFKHVKSVNDYLYGLGLGMGSKIDTMAILNIGNAAYNMGEKDTAAKYYQQLADINYGATRSLQFLVSCNPGGFNVTYTNGSGGTEQQKVTATQWLKSLSGKKGDIVSISAQAENKNASIDVKIINNGNVIKEAKSQGDMVVVSTSATLKENSSIVGGGGNDFVYKVLLAQYRDKDDSQYLATLDKAKSLFPNDKDFANEEISYYNEKGDMNKLVQKLEAEVAKDPNDYNAVLNLAITYDNMANPKTDSGTTAALPANHDELFNKAITYYKKAISLKPDGYAANFNLGLMYYNNAAHLGAQLGKLTTSKSDEAKQDTLIKQQAKLLKGATPYLEKAFQILDAKATLNPSELAAYKNAIIGLQGVYARQNNMDKYNELKKKLAAADSKAQ